MGAAVLSSARLARAVSWSAVLCLMAGWAPAARAQSDTASAVSDTLGSDSVASAPAPERAPLVVFGDTIAWFRVVSAGVAPARRAAIAHDRLEGLRSAQLLQPVRSQPLERGHMVLVGDLYAFMFMDGDEVAAPRLATMSALDQVQQRLGQVLRARAHRMAPGQRLFAVAMTLVGTLVLVVLLRLLMWAQRFARAWIERQHQSHRTSARLGELDFLSHFTWLISWLARAAAQLGAAVLVVIWAVFVLNRFPETEPIGTLARSTMLGVLFQVQANVIGAIPELILIAVIVFGARFATRLSGDVFAGVERGTLHLPGMHPETAQATRRLIDAAIWLFAIVVAYPLLPGSGSDAFKGVSVFLGLMVTLGSSGVMGHLMSGLVIVYSRALKAGDFVRVNEIEGMVVEVGALSVKVINSRKEEFTIPNAVIVGTTVKNFSRIGREAGPALTTGVTIGYDAPWRVVYEMLLAAADRTPGVRKQPAPVVFQPELSDFYVVYQLTVRLEADADRLAVLTALHQNIQDAFNERGVQIMSPHYEGQPDGRVWVPKSKWTAAPDDAER